MAEDQETAGGCLGCDLLYAPAQSEIYPEGFVTKIDPGPLATVLEGSFRPGHFSGVATVDSPNFMQAMPGDCAFFGEKDYQQLLIVRRMVRDLNIPVHIMAVTLVRDTDGLAALLAQRLSLAGTAQAGCAAAKKPRRDRDGKLAQTGEDIDATLKAAREKLKA